VSRYPLFAILLTSLVLAVPASPTQATMPPREGALPPEIAAALRDGLFEPQARPARLGVSAAQQVWLVPVILVSYSDQALTYDAAAFDSALFDTTGATATGSVHDYYQWASGGWLNVLGRVVATVNLPENKLYYGFNSWGLSRTSTPNNSAGLVKDALLACAADVPWADYDLDRDGFVDMLWVVHAGIGGEGSPDRYDNDLWSITSQLSGYWSNSNAFETPVLVPGSPTQHMQVNRFSILPELSVFSRGQRSEIGVYCHEFGHAIDLPDLYDTSDLGATNSGPGNWSLMGTGVYGGDGHSPEYPTHVGAWPALFLGWAQAVRPARDTTMVLRPLGEGTTVLELWFQGEPNPEHFLVEARKRAGFDRNLPAEGLVVYHVDDALIGHNSQSSTASSGMAPGLILLEADGNSDLTHGHNRGDAGDAFPGATNRTYLFDGTPPPNTLTFNNAPSGVGLFHIAPVAQGMQFLAQVRAPGWRLPADGTLGEYAPIGPSTPASTVALAPDGTGYSVESELRSGHRQIVLRTRRDGVWSEGVPVSSSSGDAIEPALTLLGDRDIAIVWSDTREGLARLYYRARVGGYWVAEQALPALPGESRAPAIAADGRGEVYVAWVAFGLSETRIMCLRFPYLSPYGQPLALSPASVSPGNPSLAARRVGGAVVTWTNDSAWPPTLWFARCQADAPPTAPQPLTRSSGLPQSWGSVAYDTSGSLHCLWIESGPSACELHYARLTSDESSALEDTTLEYSNSTLANARLACDQAGGLHVAFERVVGGVAEVRYRRRQPALGWDAVSTDITSPGDGPALQPRLLASAPNAATVLYRGFQGSSPRFMERRRVNDDSPLVAVTDLPPVSSAPRLFLRPNPARAGQEVEIRLPARPLDGPVALRDGSTAQWADAQHSNEGAGPGSPSTVLEVFDVAGRRVAAVSLAPQGAFLQGRLGAELTRRWPTGVYLLRARPGVPAAAWAGAVQRLVILR
jgi:M6 family metalloprotease-like protein